MNPEKQTVSHAASDTISTDERNIEVEATEEPRSKNVLHRDLQGRHMQMIALGGSIGAGLFVGIGKALYQGGPGALTVGFVIVTFMMLLVMQALGELATMYPVDGAFYTYFVRFLDPSWGFACGWDYALGWLLILPFEITAVGITIQYWGDDLNIGIWIAVILVILVAIQFFGVRGYGEAEFILSLIKVIACTGFIILGIIIDCGGVPTDTRGYIGARYWYEPYSPGGFKSGFHGFCSVFVTASFAFGGTELMGLTAAESADPAKQIPKATKQVFWRCAIFFLLNVFLIGLIVPSNSDRLLGSTGANTKASPFVYAIELAGIRALPSIFNAAITITVLSVANSASYGFTRTAHALANNGMAPKLLAYVDAKGRPVATVVLQMLVALLAFVNLTNDAGDVLFTWLLALSGLSSFFVWGSICAAHIRFRQAWALAGHEVSDLPFRALLGIGGSYVGLFLNIICLMASIYVALFPLGGSPNAMKFFENALSVPVTLALFLGWKVRSFVVGEEHARQILVPLSEIDVNQGLRDGYTGYREDQIEMCVKGWNGWSKSIFGALF